MSEKWVLKNQHKKPIHLDWQRSRCVLIGNPCFPPAPHSWSNSEHSYKTNNQANKNFTTKKPKCGSVRRCQIGFHIITHQERMDDSSGKFQTKGKHRENALPTTRDFKLIIHLEAIDDSSNLSIQKHWIIVLNSKQQKREQGDKMDDKNKQTNNNNKTQYTYPPMINEACNISIFCCINNKRLGSNSCSSNVQMSIDIIQVAAAYLVIPGI